MKKLLSATLAALIGMSSASVLAVNAAEAHGFVMADSDGDGEMSVQDATLIQKYLANLSNLENKGLLASDVDGDGDVMINDATHVQKLLVGLEDPNSLPSSESDASIKKKGSSAMNEFSAKLLKSSVRQGKNTFVSPLSVMYALAMTANGAKGKTLDEMEKTLGMNNYEMNRFFQAYPSYLRYEDSSYTDDFGGYHPADRFNIANSIWINNSENMPGVSKSFLQSSKDFYDAEITPLAFDDSAVSKINGWVNEKTDNMIPSIIDEIEPNALMYLINAISFEALWYEQYEDNQVKKLTFTDENGNTTRSDYLCSVEDLYIHDGDKAEGVVKYYQSFNYAFAALLPKEGTSLNSYVQSLTGERISEILGDVNRDYDVYTRIPKFKVKYGDTLNDNLISMGMSSAFDNSADFSRMLSNPNGFPLELKEVVHKTFIDLNEAGTRAAAVTAVIPIPGAAPDYEEPERKYIYLTRPFVYMIINRDTNTPIFIGTLEDLSSAIN